MRLSRVTVLASLAALTASSFAPAVADAATPEPGSTKYLAEEAVQRFGFDALAALYTVASPVGMIEGSIASDIPYQPVRAWGESMMSKSTVANVSAENMLALGLTGSGVADPNGLPAVVPMKYDVAPDAGALKRFGVQVGTRVLAAGLGTLYTVVNPVAMIVGSAATLIPTEAAKKWGHDTISQSVYAAKVTQDLLAIAFAGKMIDVPDTMYGQASHLWGWDDGRSEPTKTTPAPATGASGSASQRPSVGIAPGSHVSIPGGNSGFHH